MKPEDENFIVHAIPVLKDNIIWIWVEGNQAVVVDPAIAEPVQDWLNKRSLTLKAVLQTHHHEDHIGGTKELLRNWPKASVIASKEDISRIPFQTKSIAHADQLNILDTKIKVIGVAGHTNAHVAYYLSDTKNLKKSPVLFCGDTLFGAGCGRLFEGTPADMFLAMSRINSLPANTKIYCAHEYTEQNLKWANSLYPEDLSIKSRLLKVSKKRKNGKLTLPTDISEERKTNLFLRAKSVEEFSKLRKHKDDWKG